MAKLTANPAKATANTAPAKAAPAPAKAAPAPAPLPANTPALQAAQAAAPGVPAAALAAALAAAQAASPRGNTGAKATHVCVWVRPGYAKRGASAARFAQWQVGITGQQYVNACGGGRNAAADIQWDTNGQRMLVVLAPAGHPSAVAAQAWHAAGAKGQPPAPCASLWAAQAAPGMPCPPGFATPATGQPSAPAGKAAPAK